MPCCMTFSVGLGIRVLHKMYCYDIEHREIDGHICFGFYTSYVLATRM